MQCWVGDEYFGNLQVTVHRGERRLEIPFYCSVPLSSGSFGSEGMDFNVSSISLDVKNRNFSINANEMMARDEVFKMHVREECRRANVCETAKLTMNRMPETMQVRYDYRWLILDIPLEHRERIFDMSNFEPA